MTASLQRQKRRNGKIAGSQPGHSSLKAVISVIHQKLTKLHPKDRASQLHHVVIKVQHVDSVSAKPVGVDSLSKIFVTTSILWCFVCTTRMQIE